MPWELKKYNENPVLKLERRLFEMGCYTALIGTVLLALLDLFFTGETQSIPYQIVAFVLVVTILALSKKERYLEPLKFIFIFSLIIIFDVYYMTTNGQSLGIGNVAMFFLICFVSLVLFKKDYRLIVLILESLNLLVLMIKDYSNFMERNEPFTSAVFSRYFFIILLFGMGGFIVIYIKTKYEFLSARLIDQNLEIMDLNQELERKVVDRTEQLSEINDQLSLHLYRSSHDFKRPLTTLLGIHEVARLEDTNDQSMELFNHIRNTVSDMDNMLVKFKMLHEINCFASGENYITVDDMLAFVIENFNNSQVDIEKSIDIKFYNSLDPRNRLLEIILINLLENAIQFNIGSDKLIGIRIIDDKKNLKRYSRKRQ